jgi:hypothetical protein
MIAQNIFVNFVSIPFVSFYLFLLDNREKGNGAEAFGG